MAAPDDLTPETAVAAFLSPQLARLPGPIGVAVSGGGDSLALLLAALDFARDVEIPLHAATVDHGLRPEAAGEARDVADLCAARGIPHSVLTLSLADGSGVQARARAARYAALRDWANAEGIAPVLLGHTRDDVAESMVMRLRRGVGLDGLAEMPRRWEDSSGLAWGRPFLDIGRADLRSYLAERDILPIEDPSNEDTRFERVEVRKALATLGWTDGALARSARHLARAAQSYDARLDVLFDACFEADGGDLLLDASRMRGFMDDEPDSFRRMLLAALAWIGGRPAPREPEQDRLIRFLRHPGAPGATLAGCRVVREDGAFRLFRELSACQPPVPFGEIWDGRWSVDGPDTGDLTIGALGIDAPQVSPTTCGRPVAALMADPVVRRGDTLIAAPTAGQSNGYSACLRTGPRAAFRRRPPFSN